MATSGCIYIRWARWGALSLSIAGQTATMHNTHYLFVTDGHNRNTDLRQLTDTSDNIIGVILKNRYLRQRSLAYEENRGNTSQKHSECNRCFKLCRQNIYVGAFLQFMTSFWSNAKAVPGWISYSRNCFVPGCVFSG